MTNDNVPAIRPSSRGPPQAPSDDLARSVVYVVDDDPATGRRVGAALAGQGIRVETCHSASAFLKSYSPEQRGCLLLDADMPGLSGPAVQNMLAEQNVHVPVIFLTGVADIDTCVALMKRGAFDLIQKPFQKERLIEVVTQALRQDARLATVRQRQAIARARYRTLKERERQVLQLVVSGLANKQIARKLDLSEKTIEVHRSRAMSKMGADSLAELVRMSMDVGVEQAHPTT